MSSSIPQSLIDSIKSNQVVPIVGAGVSQSIKDKQGNTVFPSWKSLLEKAAKKLKEEAENNKATLVEAFIEENDYGQAAKWAHEGLKGANWNKFFKELFDPKLNELDEKSTDLPKAIWKLSNQIITLNYDKILQWSHTKSSITIIDNNSKAELADFQKISSTPTVWHLHGKIDNCAELILTPDSYDKLYPTSDSAKVAYEAALETLKTVSTNRSLLFIGCSLDDAELLAEIHKQQKIFADNTGPHYALVRKQNVDEIKAKLKGVNIKLIPFDDFGDPLVQLINEIAQHRQAKIAENTLTLSEKPEIEDDTHPAQIALLSANPLDQEQGYSDLMKEIRKIKCTIDHFSLNIENLNDLNGYHYIIILSTVTKNRLLIENEYMCRQRLSFTELEDNIGNDNTAGVFIFVDKLPDEEYIHSLKQPTLIIPQLEKKQLISIAFQLFRKNNLDHFESSRLLNPEKFQTCEQTNKAPIKRPKTDLPNDIDSKTVQNFIGRSGDLEQISRKLISLEDEGGFLTIKGSGGIGKTTAIKKIAVALAKRNKFSAGIFFVDCEFIADSHQFEYKVASAFNLEQAEDKKEHLKKHHDNKSRLIILDNVETLLHVEKEDTKRIKEFLSFICDYATVVITSRELLKIDGELLHEMRSFTTDEAVELFLSVYDQQQIDKDERVILRRDILEILLDNNPLAITLIAANMPKGKRLSVLKEELETDLFNKISDSELELFDAESDFNIERKKSIYGSILYSYKYLSEDEKQVFELLSLFPDGIDLEEFKRLNQKHKKDKKQSEFKATIISDRVIKALENKSMLENNGGDIKLQSIVGKFAEVQLNKRENLTFIYRNALEYNMSLMSSLHFLERENKSIALKIFDNLKGNFYKSIHFRKEVDINGDEFMDYVDDLEGFSIDTSSIKGFIDHLSPVAGQFKGEQKECVNLLLLQARYFIGEFKQSYEILKNSYSIDSLLGLNKNNLIERIIFLNASNIHIMEGEGIIALAECHFKSQISNNRTYSHHLFYLGEFHLDLLRSFKHPTFINMEVLYAFNRLTLIEIDDFLANVYEKSHIEIVQVSYLRSRIKALEKKQVEKLVNVNSYTRGLKKLMLAFIDDDTSIVNQLYQEAIEHLEHIKYYCVEAQYLYAKFLQESESSEFNNVYQKGLALSQKHHYRYLQYCFDTLLNPDIEPYDTKNYPLPNNEDFSEYIQFLIKGNKNILR